MCHRSRSMTLQNAPLRMLQNGGFIAHLRDYKNEPQAAPKGHKTSHLEHYKMEATSRAWGTTRMSHKLHQRATKRSTKNATKWRLHRALEGLQECAADRAR